ncbi:MAG: FAD-dependent monooxygenase [Clostridia bacterium]|nr:FAD-dependent monooxygenase [Clostridia bacterium]
MLKLSNLRAEIGFSSDTVQGKIEKLIGTEIKNLKIAKRAIDARRKKDVHYVLTAEFEVENENRILSKSIANLERKNDEHYIFPNGKLKTRPIIVGTGPAGLFSALFLARCGAKPIVLERGEKVDDRQKSVDSYFQGGKLNEESNIQFGEGGAGTFSDGKLNTGTKNIRIRTVLEEFVSHGASPDILVNSKPHIGTDVLRKVVKSMREEIISLGGEVRFNTKMTDLKIEDGEIKGVYAGDEFIPSDTVVLAIGHSARDTLLMLRDKGIRMEKKPFSIGARIEHKQDFIGNAMYGDFYKKLPAADYKMAVHLNNGRSLYTFCMCPGGYVVAAASEKDTIVTNGMSYSDRSGENANSAVLVGITPDDFPGDDVLSGMYLQREIEKKAYEVGKGKAPCQTLGSFLFGKENTVSTVKPTYKPGVNMCDISKVFPDFIADSLKEGLLLMNKKIPGFAMSDAILTAPETRSSSPVKMIRDENMMLSVKGLYSAGEGGGFAGGITSSAVDGIRVAEAIIVNAKKTV